MDIAIDVGQRIWLQGDHLGSRGKSRAQRSFYIAQAHRAYFALGLGDYVSRFQALQHVIEYAINALCRREGFFHALIDLAAVAVDVKNRLGANGKLKNLRRIIALMRAPHLKIAEPERIHHFGGAGNQGDDSHSPNIPLAFFGCALFLEQSFQLLSLALCVAQGSDVQEANLELNLGEGVHNLLYRTYDGSSIGLRYSLNR